MTKLKKLTLRPNTKNFNVTKFKNSNCDKTQKKIVTTQNSNCDNSKTQIAAKLENSNCEKLKNLNCDKTKNNCNIDKTKKESK